MVYRAFTAHLALEENVIHNMLAYMNTKKRETNQVWHKVTGYFQGESNPYADQGGKKKRLASGEL